MSTPGSDPDAYTDSPPSPTDREILMRIDANTGLLVEIGDRAVTALEGDQRRKDRAAKARQKLWGTVADRVLQPRVVGVLSMAVAVAIVAYALAGTGMSAKVADYFEISPTAVAAPTDGDAAAPDPDSPIDP